MSRLQLGLDASFLTTYDESYSLKYPLQAESAGFDTLWLGDHFLPWHHSFKHSFFVWEVLAAVASRTRRINVGPDVTVPIGGRYHPAIIAQASSTMDRLFPGRFVLGVGSGEAMSEARFMGVWPKWEERMERLLEGIDLIRKLWSEKDYFDFRGKYFKMEKVFLHLKPTNPIPIYFSALGEKSAYLAGRHADILLSVGTVKKMKEVIFPKFEEGARSAGRNPDKIKKCVAISFGTGPVDKVVRRLRKYTAGSLVSSTFNELDPRKIEKVGAKLSDEDILGSTYTFQGGDAVIEVLSHYRKIGVDEVIIGELSTDPENAMKIYSSKVIPYFRRE